MTEYEELRQRIADYLTGRFVFDPSEVPKDECHKEADYVLAEVFRTLETVTTDQLEAARVNLGLGGQRKWIPSVYLAMLRASPLKAP